MIGMIELYGAREFCPVFYTGKGLTKEIRPEDKKRSLLVYFGGSAKKLAACQEKRKWRKSSFHVDLGNKGTGRDHRQLKAANIQERKPPKKK